MRKYLIALAVLATGSAAATAETWNVTRGEGASALKGDWNVAIAPGGGVSGSGFLSAPGREPVRFTIGGVLNGGMFTLKTTVDPSQKGTSQERRRTDSEPRTQGGGHSCMYIGRDQSPAFGGSAMCGDHKANWHAVRIR